MSFNLLQINMFSTSVSERTKPTFYNHMFFPVGVIVFEVTKQKKRCLYISDLAFSDINHGLLKKIVIMEKGILCRM